VFERIRDIIADQLEVDAAEITLETRLLEDLKADSLDVVELVMDLEQEFDMEIPDELLPEIHTVKDIIDYIEKH